MFPTRTADYNLAYGAQGESVASRDPHCYINAYIFLVLLSSHVRTAINNSWKRPRLVHNKKTTTRIIIVTVIIIMMTITTTVMMIIIIIIMKMCLLNAVCFAIDEILYV